jgi:hypothetical protein
MHLILQYLLFKPIELNKIGNEDKKEIGICIWCN